MEEILNALEADEDFEELQAVKKYLVKKCFNNNIIYIFEDEVVPLQFDDAFVPLISAMDTMAPAEYLEDLQEGNNILVKIFLK